MGWLLLALIIAVPVAEIAAFVAVSREIGLLAAVGLAVVAGLAGMALVRGKSISVLFRARSALDRGQLPINEAFDGICLFLAGGLLLLPGFISDGLALLLLLPPVRRLLRQWLAHRLVVRRGGPVVIEGDYTEVHPPPAPGPNRLPHDS